MTEQTQNRTLCELVDSLLQLPVALENGFADASIESVGSFLEEGSELGSDSSSDMQPMEDPDILTALEIFAPLLFEMEQLQIPTTTPLSQLKQLCPHCQQEDHLEVVEQENRLAEQIPSSHTATTHYIRLADLVTDHSQQLESSVGSRAQLILLSLALENELTFKLKGKLVNSWPHLVAISKMIGTPKDGRFVLDAELVAKIRALGEKSPELLYKKRLPLNRITTSLSFVLKIETPEKYFPNFFEFGIFLLLFSQNDLDGFPLKNILEVSGLPPEQVVDCAFRLFRLEQMRPKLWCATSQLTEEHISVLKQDIQSVLNAISTLLENQEDRTKVA